MNSMTEQVRIAALSMVNYASNLCSKENSDRKEVLADKVKPNGKIGVVK